MYSESIEHKYKQQCTQRFMSQYTLQSATEAPALNALPLTHTHTHTHTHTLSHTFTYTLTYTPTIITNINTNAHTHTVSKQQWFNSIKQNRSRKTVRGERCTIRGWQVCRTIILVAVQTHHLMPEHPRAC